MAKTHKALSGFLIISAFFLSVVCVKADDASNEPNEADAPEQTTAEDALFDAKPASDFWIVSKGMILSELKPVGRIIGSKEEKTMLGEGDIVYLASTQGPFAPEKEWVVFRNIKKVRHPKTGNDLGSLIQVVGLVKVIQADNESVTGQIIYSNDLVLKGDQLASLESLSQPVSFSEKPAPAEKEVTIVEAKDSHVDNGQMDVVYIDRGKREGVMVGDRFEIFHGASRPEKVSLPRKKVGTLLILSIQDQTATAEIIENSDPILKGDVLLPLPRK